MLARQLFALVSLGLFVSPSFAEEVRFYEKDSVTYREVHRRTQRPLVETRMQQQQQTVYRQQLTTEVRPLTQTIYTPVTTYHWEPRWHGLLNPFTGPYIAYHPVPVTHWQSHSQEVQIRVTRRDWVPETRTVQVPVTTRRMVEEEVITRTAVGTSGAGSAASVARGGVGGVSRLENDPPRLNSDWRPADPTIRR